LIEKHPSEESSFTCFEVWGFENSEAKFERETCPGGVGGEREWVGSNPIEACA
jgi:hypothetical protein